MQIKEVLVVHTSIDLLPLNVGITYYELIQLWIFQKTNYFKEAVEEFKK